MILKLNNIDVACVIGEREEERTRTQTLRVDVALTVDPAPAETDQLEDAVDYAQLTALIRATLRKARCRMIERAAKLVADVCRGDPRVSHGVVTVTKSGAIAHLESASVIAEW